mmetsp:Transcript_62674/g.166726  ORF Transcript_62674/g.166726 Transcript_62674/m.166726 type:complete len:94 (+) Transcript_62674:203-484(+)
MSRFVWTTSSTMLLVSSSSWLASGAYSTKLWSTSANVFDDLEAHKLLEGVPLRNNRAGEPRIGDRGGMPLLVVAMAWGQFAAESHREPNQLSA